MRQSNQKSFWHKFWHKYKWRIIITIGVCIGGVIYSLGSLFLDDTPVVLQTDSQQVTVQAELALTPMQQAVGLMFRSELPENAGMLFVFPRSKMVFMWMKNTYIPLDMIFFNQEGVITHIHENAVPHDETIISSKIPAQGVLEVNAGFVRRHQIRIGNRMIRPQIKIIDESNNKPVQ